MASFMDSFSNVNVEFQGIFSRNYQNDITGVDEVVGSKANNLNISLSRDSLFHVLPEGLFFNENTLKKLNGEKNEEKFKAEDERINKEKQKLKLFFNPFDKTYFGLRFELEKKLNQIAQNRTQILTDELFDIYNINGKNKLIRKCFPALPIASEFRGNRLLCKELLKNIFFPAAIDLNICKKRNRSGQTRRYTKTIIHIEKLSTAEFRELKRDIDDFGLFFYEWFLPVDMGYEFKIKDTKEAFVLGKAMTLDYNTYLK